jgi:hypothetical protein
MQGTVYMVRLGDDIMPHFRLDNELYIVRPGVEVLFEISGEAEPKELLGILFKKTLEEAKRRGLKVNPRDFE